MKDLSSGCIAMIYQYQWLFLKGPSITFAFPLPSTLFNQPGSWDFSGTRRCRVGWYFRVFIQQRFIFLFLDYRIFKETSCITKLIRIR